MKRVVTALIIHTDNSMKTNISFSLIPTTQLPVVIFDEHNWENLQYIASFTKYSGWYKIDKPKKYANYHEHPNTLKHNSDTSSRVTVDNNFLKHTPSRAIK